MNAKKTSLLIVLLLLAGTAHAITPAGTVITNVAHINYQSSNGLASYQGDSNPVQTTVSGVTQLSITKSGPAQTVAGAIEGFTYTIVVQNTGSTVETGLEVADPLPSQVNFESASQNGSLSSGQVQWTGISLGPGASQTLTVKVSTSPSTPAQVITNRAQLIRQGEKTPSNPVDTQILEQLTLQKHGTAQKPGNQAQTSQRGGIIDYTITCTNPNPVTIHGVRLIDVLPDFADATQISAGGSLNANQVVWVVGDLAPGASQLVQLSLQVRDNAPLGTLTNIVTVTSDELDDVVAQAHFGIVEAFGEQPDFDFTKRHDRAEAGVGEEIIYTISLENRGSTSIQNAIISDALESAISYIDGSATDAGVYSTSNRTVSWGPFSELPAGNVIEVSFRVRVAGPVPVNGGQVENFAVVRSQRILDTPSNTVTTNLRGERLQIELVADPEVILGDGIATSLLTATVHKASGALADDGTPVTLTTNRGIFMNGTREISGTTASGIITAQLRSEVITGNSVRADIVASTADGAGGEVADQAHVTFAPAAILGIVTDWLRNSAPVVGAEVVIAGNIIDSAVTDATGRYMVPVVESSSYSLGISTSDFLGRRISVLETVDVQAAIGRVFSSKNAITGVVLDAATNQPVTGGLVRIVQGDDVVKDNIPTDINGRYTATGLNPANYRVELASALDGFGSQSILVNLNQAGHTMINANLDLSRLPSLQLDKVVNRSVAFPGDELVYTISYNNAGGEARNITLTDTIPAGTVFQQASAGGVFHGGIVTWNLAEIPAGGAGTVEVRTLVGDSIADNTSIQNIASLVQPGIPDPLTASTTTVVRQVVLSMAKNANVAQIQPGADIVYMLAYSNTGGRIATGVTVRDTLPSGTSVAAATPGASQIGQSLIWDVGTLPPGSTQTLEITLRLDETYSATQLTNTATVLANEVGPVSSSSTVDVVFAPILSVEKRANVTSARPGDEVLYTIVYQNAGLIDATGMQVVDRLPPEVEHISGGTYTPGAHSITWDIGRLIANSAPQTLNVRARVLNTASVEEFVNVAEVRSNEGPPVTAQVTVTLLPTVHATKAVDKASAKSGEQLTYTLLLTNQGGTATNAIFSDVLPANTTFVSASGQPTVENNVVTWRVGQLAPQASHSYKLVLEVAGEVPSGTIIENQGTFHSDQISTSTQVVRTTVENPILEFEKIAPAQTQPGEQLSYTLSYRNAGSVDATDVVITDTVPGNTRYANALGADMVEAEGIEPGSIVTWHIGTVPAGESGSVELIVLVDASPGTHTISNTASIESREIPAVTSSVQTHINIRTGLTLEKEAFDTEGNLAEVVATGDVLTYRFTYQNLGNVAASDVTITDKLPEQLEYLDGGSYNAQNRTVILTIGEIPADSAEESASFRVRVVSNLTPQIHEVTNVAQIEDGSGETTEDTYTVLAMPPFLQLQLVGDRRVIEVGDATALVIHVENTSIHDLIEAEITNLLPLGFEYIPGTSIFNGIPIPDPEITKMAGGKVLLTWTTTTDSQLELPANSKHELVFRARLIRDPGNVFSVEHIAGARGKTKTGAIGDGKQATVVARPDEWRLRIRRPMVAGDGLILGKVFVDRDGDREQDVNESGFPNARLFLEDGRIVVTDEFGKYSIPEVGPGIHVIKLDKRSLPENYIIVRHTTRAAGDPTSQFLDVPADAVEKADFILQEIIAEEPVTSRTVIVPTVEITQPKLGAFAPPIIPEVEIYQPEQQQISTPVAPAQVEQPAVVRVTPRLPEPIPTPDPISTPVRMPSVGAPLSPPKVNVHFKPDRIPAGDPILTVTADKPLTRVVAEHPDGRRIFLKQDGEKWQHEFTVPFESPEGPYPFMIWVTDTQGIEWHNFALVMIDNSIPNIYAEFVPKVTRPGQVTTLKVTLLIDAVSVTISLRNGTRLKLQKDKRFHWSTTYTVPSDTPRGWHNGEITVIAVEGNFKQRAIVAYKVQ